MHIDFAHQHFIWQNPTFSTNLSISNSLRLFALKICIRIKQLSFLFETMLRSQVHSCSDVTSRKQQSRCPAKTTAHCPLNLKSSCDSCDILSGATVGAFGDNALSIHEVDIERILGSVDSEFLQ